MQIELITYRQWSKAYRCSAGAAELVVVTQIGPRILSLRWHNGPNLLYEDFTGFGVDDWRLYGGHRFTVAPESRESYAPDNARCEVERGPAQLYIWPPGRTDGTQPALTITAAADGDGFDLHHVLHNRGRQPWQGALWAITCVPQAALAGPCDRAGLRFWPGSNPADWALGPDHVSAAPRKKRGKIGWHSPAGWLASLQAQGTLVIHDPNPPPVSDCADGGCNVEVFACPNYLELETLGRKAVVAPDGQTELHQRWRLLPGGWQPADWALIAERAGCTSTQA